MKHLKHHALHNSSPFFRYKNLSLLFFIISIGIATPLSASPLQEIDVTGTVMDAEGFPLPGATIIEKGRRLTK